MSLSKISSASVLLKRTLLPCLKPSYQQSRCIERLLPRRTTKSFHRTDKFSMDGYTLIYNARMHNYTLGASCAILMYGTVLTYLSVEWIRGNKEPGVSSESILGGIPLFQNFLNVLVPVVVQGMLIAGVIFFIRRTPIRIYHSKQYNDYVVIFQGVLPFTSRKVAVNSGEFRVSKSQLPFYVQTTLFRGRHYFLDSDSYKHPKYFHDMYKIT